MNVPFLRTLLKLLEQTLNFTSITPGIKSCIIVSFFKLMSAPLSNKCCCFMLRSVVEFLYHHLVCSHQLPQAPGIRWRQFGCILLPNEELSNHTHHSHPQAFHLSTSHQPLWRHHQSLHERSCQWAAHQFLGMKNDCI